MSTCELDRFVIQTPYIKVVKSCSAPFVDRTAGHDHEISTTDRWTNGTNKRDVDERTDGRTGSVQVLFWVPASPVTHPIDR